MQNKVCESAEEKCVPYYLCHEDSKAVITDGALLIDERLDGPKGDIKTCPSLERCCLKIGPPPLPPPPPSTINVKPITPKPPVTHQQTTTQNQSIREWKYNSSHFYYKKIYIYIVPPIFTKRLCNDVFSTPSECGYRNEKGLGGVLKNLKGTINYAQYAEFPWIVAILTDTKVGSKQVSVYRSAGSLIHPKVVLSTAHNIADVKRENIVIRAGEFTIFSTASKS